MRPKSSIFYGLLVIAIGAVLIAFNNRGELLNWVVTLVGIAFIIPCLYTLISAISDDRRMRRAGSDTIGLRFMTTGVVMTSVIGIGLGIWLVASPDFFIRFIAYAFAVILILYGIYHLCVLVWLCRPVQLPVGYYIIPLLLIVAGVAIIATNLRYIKSTVIIITGLGLIGSGISSILEYVAANGAYRKSISGQTSGEHTAG